MVPGNIHTTNPRKDIGNSEGGGSFKVKNTCSFPDLSEGEGGSTPKSFCRRGRDIFWNSAIYMMRILKENRQLGGIVLIKPRSLN